VICKFNSEISKIITIVVVVVIIVFFILTRKKKKKKVLKNNKINLNPNLNVFILVIAIELHKENIFF
jgi:preprotein translocase subunit YajC